MIIIPLLAAASFSCAARHPELSPAAGPCFRHLTMKFSFRDGETRQSGRVLWRFDAGSSKFIFFNALNQSGLELDVAGEYALLVNHGKKAFWRGDFSRLLDRIWGIALTHDDLKSLLDADGATPAGFADKEIEVALERAAGSGALETVRLRRLAADLSLRILKDELRPGKIVLVNYAERYRPLDLESVLEDD